MVVGVSGASGKSVPIRLTSSGLAHLSSVLCTISLQYSKLCYFADNVFI